MPRLQTIPVNDLKREILAAKDEVIIQDKISSKSSPIWETIGQKCSMKGTSVYTFVICNRHNIRDELLVEPGSQNLQQDDNVGNRVILSRQPPCNEDEGLLSDIEDDTDYDEDFESEGENRIKDRFTVTISPDEWQKMSPIAVTYKCNDAAKPNRKSREYTIFRDSEWTRIMQEHFWAHTSLSCCLTFKRAKLFTAAATNYCVMHAVCRDCKSNFQGIIKNHPKPSARILVHCTYSRTPSNELCTSKRQLAGTSRVEAVRKLSEQRISASMYRKQMASFIMEAGDVEPSHIPSQNVLRVAKSKFISANRLDNHPVVALSVAKSLPPLQGVIRDIGYNRFFVHYWSSLQINVYNEYCKKTDYPKVSIDATGGLVRRLVFEGGDKSGHIFLYEITVQDTTTHMQFSVGNMLSERHDTNSITFWLSEWIRSGAARPKLIVTDMSLALLAAAVRSFTRFQSLSDYLLECGKVLCNGLQSVVVPECQIRCDVAHVMKNITMWPCLHGKTERVRQFYIRSMAQLIQCTEVDDARNLLDAIFTVALSETEGRDVSTNEETLCEKRKSWLKNRIAGDLPCELPIHETDTCTTEGQTIAERSVLEEAASVVLLGNTDESRSFESWAQTISDECRRCATTNGDRDNLQYLPEISSTVVKLMRYFPVWSAIMIPAFKYGGITASSAPVESSFNDLKNRTLAHRQVPLRVDDFLPIHATTIDGAMKLAAAPNLHVPKACTAEYNQAPLSPSSRCTESYSPHVETVGLDNDVEEDESSNESRCPACSAGDEPQGAHRCIICSRPVHPFPECSSPVDGEEEGYGERRKCHTCARQAAGETHGEIEDNRRPMSETGRLEGEDIVRKESNSEMHQFENWRNLGSVPAKKRRRYLDTQTEWKHMDLSINVGKSRVIGILRNGETNLKPILIDKVKYISTNTCAFDSTIQLLCTSFCDHQKFHDIVEQSRQEEKLLQLVEEVAVKGVTSRTYRMRMIILREIFTLNSLPLGLMQVSAEYTAKEMVSKILPAPLCNKEITTCVTNPSCTGNCSYTQAAVSVRLTEGNFNRLEEKLNNDCLRSTSTVCVHCHSEREHRLELSSALFIEPYFTSERCTSDIVSDVAVSLGDIPTLMNLEGKQYMLAGAIGFSHSGTVKVSSAGHYVAYSRRLGDHWESYDDVSKKVKICSRAKLIRCNLLLYIQQ